MLGKRGRRPPIKRTTSMTEFTADSSAPPSTNYSANRNDNPQDQAAFRLNIHPQNGPLDGADQRPDDDVSPASSRRLPPQRRYSADFAETAQFLRVCYLCNRRLVPGHDIYMYRGDNAFCSLECRQRKMAQDDRKAKKSLEATTTAVPQVSTTAGETVTAVV